MRSTCIAALIAASVVPAACGDSDPTGPDHRAGSFELQLSGAVAETAEGPAWFGSDVNDNGDPVFVVIFGDGESRHTIILGKVGSSRPAVGEYPIGTAQTDWTLVHIVSDAEELEGMFYATEGVVTITHSTALSLRGTITFAAAGVLGNEEAEIAGEVSFEAIGATSQMMTRTQPASLLAR